jgi:hypothetical protein
MRFIRKLYRAIQYAIHGYGSEDYDHAHLYLDMSFKLKRMYKDLDRYDFIDKKHYKHMRTAYLLLDRLANDDNDYLSSHNAKWGDIKMSFIPIKDKDCSRVMLSRKNVVAPEQEKQERVEFKHWCDIEKECINNELKLFCKLFERHSRGWWT